jgi:hypothetical protein
MAEIGGQPLSDLQLDILELEAASWIQPGNKFHEFKARHPHVTVHGYTVVLLRLLSDRRAWEYDNGRYATTLARIQRLHADREAARLHPERDDRGVVPE